MAWVGRAWTAIRRASALPLASSGSWDDEQLTRTPATRSQSADVVVIGGGVCGLSTARYLAGRGKSVVLVERGCVASVFQASAVNCAFIDSWSDLPTENPDALLNVPLGTPLNDILLRWQYRYLREPVAMSRNGVSSLWPSMDSCNGGRTRLRALCLAVSVFGARTQSTRQGGHLLSSSAGSY
jgi:hypothetical protein